MGHWPQNQTGLIPKSNLKAYAVTFKKPAKKEGTLQGQKTSKKREVSFDRSLSCLGFEPVIIGIEEYQNRLDSDNSQGDPHLYSPGSQGALNVVNNSLRFSVWI